jgi:hypothetical protein
MMVFSTDLFRVEPFRTLFLVHKAAAVLLVKLPFWGLFYLRRQNRPRASWSWVKTIVLRILREVSTGEIIET